MIACGGTGGHLFPGVAVGEVLAGRGHAVLLIISEKRIDEVAVSGHREFEVRRVKSVAMPPVYSPAIVLFLLKVMHSIGQCRRIYDAFRPDAVLGMGGFTSTAPMIAGRLAGAATFIHESNVIPGKANRLNARISGQALLGFSEAAPRFPPRCRTVVTGTPVRAGMRPADDRRAVLRAFGLDGSDAPVLVVMGGSQGASAINHAMARIAPRLAASAPRVIHLTGERNRDMVKEAYTAAGIPSAVMAFHHGMAEVYTVADLVVGRSGASSLAELSHFGLPSVLIPYPYAADDHQRHNAEIFAANGAARVIPEDDQLGIELAKCLGELLANPAERRAMGTAARAHGSGLAADRVADEVLARLDGREGAP